MKTQKRKTHSDKFPLTRHPTGKYYKKIRGKMYYFGSYKQEALQSDLDQAVYLHGSNNNSQKPVNNSMTLMHLWPEIIEALKAVPKKGKLVFYTARGNPFVRNILKIDANGVRLQQK